MGRLGAIGGAFLAVLVVLAAEIGTAVGSPARAGSRADTFTVVLVKAPCGNKNGFMQVGQGCADETAVDASQWSISDGTATWTTPGFRNVYHWTTPGTLTQDGGKFTVSATASSSTGPDCDAGITVTSTESPGGAASACAEQGKSASKSASYLIIPGDPNTLGEFVQTQVTIKIDLGPTIYYDYGLAPAATSTSATTTTAVQPSGSCPLPSWLKHGRRLQSAAAINEVHVICVQPDVQFHKGGTPADAWLPMETDTVLKAGDEITCDPDGAATLAFADNSTVVVRNTTQLKIGSFFTEGGIVKTEILLKMGEIAAQINKSEATKSDFRIKSPTGVTSVRGGVMRRTGETSSNLNVVSAAQGTAFTVFSDPVSHTQVVDALQGSVDVAPSTGSAVTVPAGHEVEVANGAVSPIARIGKANARGGINRVRALDLVEAKIGVERKPCALVTPRTPVFSVLPATGGWTVSVTAVAGKAKGKSIWFAAGAKAVPKNAAAALIASGCTTAAHTGGGSHAGATDTWAGTWARTEVKGNLILVQTGSTILGHYTWGDGTGKVAGANVGSTFTGTFSETNYQGEFKLTVSGRHFTGNYTGTDKRDNGPISGPFSGTCIAGPCLKNG